MPSFELRWTMEGSAVIEADDLDEAELILNENLVNLDASMFDSWDVTDVTCESDDEDDDDDD